MQISDLLGQYQQNIATPTESVSGVKGVEQLVSTIRNMTVGNIFEGTVNQIKNGQVTLGLSNGQELTARMDGKVPLTKGQSMFFQVKSNNGTTVAIKPFMIDGNNGNLTLIDALKAAGLPAEPRNMNMVNTMMQEQLPIDKNHLMQMARLVQNNPDIDAGCVVQMDKLQIPITKENASCFINYQNDKQSISKEMNLLFEQLPEIMSEENLSPKEFITLNKQVLTILTDEASVSSFEGNTLEQILEPEELDHLLQNTLFLEEEEVPNIINESTEEIVQKPNLKSTLSPKTTTFDFLKQVLDSLPKMEEQNEIAKKFVSGKEFSKILMDFAEEKWAVKPEELKEEHKISELYEKLDQQMKQMEDVVKASGQERTTLTENIVDIRNNIQFMNQINQVYTYVQIPLKMTGQNANGELYVYTNKKDLAEQSGELSAFLHLDMENLGSTDVSLKMMQKSVSTIFYLDNDLSYDLIKEHLPELTKRLENKGYLCKASVTNEAKKVNFVDDFLKKDQPSAGKVRRYSFDVRA